MGKSTVGTCRSPWLLYAAINSFRLFLPTGLSRPKARLFFGLTAISGCLVACGSSSPSTETGGANIPAVYSAHRGGIVASPSDADVALAVQFGRHAKDHPNVVQSAYLSRLELTGASLEPFHIVVRTPLYLISRHVMEQHAQNQSADPNFVDFARRLGFVQLAVSKSTITSDTWRDYVLDREMMLFRDGGRVAPAASIPAWNHSDPFRDLNDPLDSWRSTSWLRRGVEEMQEDQLRTTEETAADKKDPLRPGRLPSGQVPLQPGEAVFAVAELRKPGRYEIVFRRAPGKPPTPGERAEIRLPISFDSFR